MRIVLVRQRHPEVIVRRTVAAAALTTAVAATETDEAPPASERVVIDRVARDRDERVRREVQGLFAVETRIDAPRPLFR